MNTKKIEDLLESNLKKINYIEIDKDEILNSVLEQINDKEDEITLNNLKNMVSRSIKIYISNHLNHGNTLDIINAYINNNIDYSKYYNKALLSMNQILDFFEKFDYYPSPDESYSLISNNEKISSILSIIYEKNENLIKEGKLESIFEDNDLLCSFIESYCVINNIEIKDQLDDTIEQYNENLDTQNLLTQYMRDVSRLPLLTRDEEIELGYKILQGDNDAINKMAAHNLRLVIKIARRYLGNGLDYEDLIQEGSIGVMTAAKKFDVTKNFKFGTYATWWIKQSIHRAITDKSRLIRIPSYLHDIINKISMTSKKLEQEIRRRPTSEEISKITNIPIKTVDECLKIIDKTSYSSLNQTITDDDETMIMDFVVDEKTNIEESYEKKSLRDELEKLFENTKTLSPREIEIIKYRYGFYGREYTLRELGEMLQLTRERIRQIESKAIKKLRNNSDLKNLSNYLEKPDEGLVKLEKDNRIKGVRYRLSNSVKLNEEENYYNIFELLSNRYSQKEVCDVLMSLNDEYAIYLRRFFGENWDKKINLLKLNELELKYVNRLLYQVNELLRINKHILSKKKMQ